MAEPQFQQSIRTDAEGAWEVALPEDLSPGLHKVTAIDESGARDEALLFVEREFTGPDALPLIERFQTIERVQPVIPPAVAWTVFILLVLIILLAVNGARLGHHADEDEEEYQKLYQRVYRKFAKVHHHFRNALIVGVVAIVLAFTVGIVLNQRTGVFLPEPTYPAPVETVFLSISGAVVTPFENQGVAGLNLTSDDISIRTDEGGRYQFQNIEINRGLRLTHPELRRAFVMTFPDLIAKDHEFTNVFPVSIYFDAALYNRLVDIIDLEARTRYSDIHGLLSPALQARESSVEFARRYSSIFSLEDISNQEIVVSKIQPHPNWFSETLQEPLDFVVEIIVENDGQSKPYYLQQMDENWLLVE